MSTPSELAIERVNSVLQELIEIEESGGPKATVSGLASRLDVKRAAFYNAFPDVVRQMAERRLNSPSQGVAGRPRDERALLAEMRLRVSLRERQELGEELAVYAEQIRRLTVENGELLADLEEARGIRRIGRQ